MSAIIRAVLTASLIALSWSANAAEPTLPLEKIELFTSGVGYFQHTGEVTGDARVEMSFKAEEINDLLKSMVVEDLDGSASMVSYASRDPITKTLDTFAVKLTDNPSMSDLLGRLRGEKIEVDAATPVTGTIVGVESRVVPVGDDKTVSRQFVTILAADGLRTLPLDSITRLRLLDVRLQSELEKALAVLALGHDNEKKSVTLAFTGKVARKVRVGLRAGVAALEDELPAHARRRRGGGRGKGGPAGLGDRGKHDRQRLEGRADVARERQADLVRDGPLPATLRAAADGAAGTVCIVAAAGLRPEYD